MSGGHLIAILALLIPIIAIIADHWRKWQTLELQAARRSVDATRRLRQLDEIERRVGDIEAYVTSPEFTLNREIGRLADKP